MANGKAILCDFFEFAAGKMFCDPLDRPYTHHTIETMLTKYIKYGQQNEHWAWIEVVMCYKSNWLLRLAPVIAG